MTGGFSLHAQHDQAVVAAFWKDEHPITHHDSSLSHNKVGWCAGPYMQWEACAVPLPHWAKNMYLSEWTEDEGNCWPMADHLQALHKHCGFFWVCWAVFFIVVGFGINQLIGRWWIRYSSASLELCAERTICLTHAQCYQYCQMLLV